MTPRPPVVANAGGGVLAPDLARRRLETLARMSCRAPIAMTGVAPLGIAHDLYGSAVDQSSFEYNRPARSYRGPRPTTPSRPGSTCPASIPDGSPR